MSTEPIPEFVWESLDVDLEWFGRGAQEALYPSGSSLAVNPTDEVMLWPGGPSNTLDSNPFVPPGIFQPMELGPASLYDFQTLAPGMPHAPVDVGRNMPAELRPPALSVDDPSIAYSWQLPSAPRFETVSLPPVDPWHSNRDHIGGGGSGNYYGNETNGNFPSRGVSEHWASTDISAQEAGMWTGLAPAKPEIIENEIRSEQSRGSTSSSSKRRYDRAKNGEGKKWRLSQIRKALGSPSTEDELLTLQKLIEHLGGNVPECKPPRRWLTKPQRQTKRRAELRDCFVELRSIVSPQSATLGDLKILTLALAMMTTQAGGRRSSEGELQQFGVFRV